MLDLVDKNLVYCLKYTQWTKGNHGQELKETKYSILTNIKKDT